MNDLFTSGEVNSNKIARVTSIATLENQEELAGIVKTMSQRAVETLIKDSKTESRPQLTHVRKLELSEEVQKRLEGLKEKGLDINGILIELLDKREEEIQIEKNEIAKETPTGFRYIKVRTRKVIKEDQGTKCAKYGCNKDAVHLHHTNRFAMSGDHNPNFLAPLCKEHHEIAHSIDLKVQLVRKRVSR